MDAKSITERLRTHLLAFWSERRVMEEQPDHGPLPEILPNFRVLKFYPLPQKPYWIYCSLGTHEVDSGHHRFEFFLLAPQENYTHVMTLAMLAYFHANPDHRLGPGHTVNIGEPWVPSEACRSPVFEARQRMTRASPARESDSQCDHLLLSLPYTFGPKLEWLRLPEFCVRILWALPITAAEAVFAEEKGVEALEQRFEAAKLDYLNPARDSVV